MNTTLTNFIKNTRSQFLGLETLFLTIHPDTIDLYFYRGGEKIASLRSAIREGDFTPILGGNNKIEAFLFFKNEEQEKASYKFLENLGSHD